MACVVAAAAAFLNACGAAASSPPPLPAGRGTTLRSSSIVSTSERSAQSGTDADLERARRAFEAGRFGAAETDFMRVYSNRATEDVAAVALFGAAASAEELLRHGEAAERFEQVARQFPNSRMRREALVRSVRLWGYVGDIERAGLLAEDAGEQMAPIEQVTMFGARALRHLERGDLATAEQLVGRGRRVLETAGLDQAGELPRDVAQLYFALGELRRIRGEELNFATLPSNFPDYFESRAQLLLDAQSAYSDVMRAQDARWTSMAGFRVAELYLNLYRDVMAMPRPELDGDSDVAQLFEGALRLRYGILLRKGIDLLDHTLAMAGRLNERNPWVQKAVAARSSAEATLRQQEQELQSLQRSPAELRAILRKMGHQGLLPGASPGSGPGT